MSLTPKEANYHKPGALLLSVQSDDTLGDPHSRESGGLEEDPRDTAPWLESAKRLATPQRKTKRPAPKPTDWRAEHVKFGETVLQSRVNAGRTGKPVKYLIVGVDPANETLPWADPRARLVFKRIGDQHLGDGEGRLSVGHFSRNHFETPAQAKRRIARANRPQLPKRDEVYESREALRVRVITTTNGFVIYKRLSSESAPDRHSDLGKKCLSVEGFRQVYPRKCT